MKRTILLCMLALGALALVSAQGNNRWGPGRGSPGGPRSQSRGQGYGFQRNVPPVEEVKVSGNLTISQGMIAVINNDTTYVAGGLNRYIGFIDGLKEGATVTLEGSARSDPQNSNIKFLWIQKLTLNGKEYDLAYPHQGVRPHQNLSPRHGNHRMHQPHSGGRGGMMIY